MLACVGDSPSDPAGSPDAATPDSGGGPDDAGPADTGGGSDAGGGGDADAGPITFCSSKAAFFCEDFDRAGGNAAMLSPTWTSPGTSGATMLASPGATVDSQPSHVQLSIAATGATIDWAQTLQHDDATLTQIPGKYHLSVHLKVLERTSPFRSTDALRFFFGNQALFIALNGSSDTTVVPGVVVQPASGPDKLVFGNNTTAAVNEWLHFDITITNGAGPLLSVSLNGVPLPRADTDAGTAPYQLAPISDASFKVRVGPSGQNDHGSIGVAYDNVVLSDQ